MTVAELRELLADCNPGDIVEVHVVVNEADKYLVIQGLSSDDIEAVTFLDGGIMLPNRIKDLEAEYHYSRYQLETLCGDVWTKGMIYACPPGKLSLLLTALRLTRTARLVRVNSFESIQTRWIWL